MLKMIHKHKEQYGKENYEEIRTGDSSQGDEVPEEDHHRDRPNKLVGTSLQERSGLLVDGLAPLALPQQPVKPEKEADPDRQPYGR